jgi:hypothetical protein
MRDRTLSDVEKAARAMLAELDPRQHFLQYRDDALAQDRVKGRGFLIVNPESDAIPKEAHGRIVQHQGGEYRVVIDKLLVGARTAEGEVVHGYWLEGKTPVPLPAVISRNDGDSG